MDENSLTRLADIVFEILVPIVVIFATWGAHRLIALFEKKAKIDVPAKIEEQIDGWIERGIALAEEKSRAKVKSKTAKLTGPEKLEMAAGFVLDLVEKYKLQDLAKEKIEKRIEARLGTKRLEGGTTHLDA